MGADTAAARQAGDRRDRGPGRGRRARTRLWCDLRVVARDAVLGVFCRRWGRAADRSRHGPVAAADRPVAGDGPDPDRSRRRCRRGAGDRPRQPHRRAGAGRSMPRWHWPPRSRNFRRSACATTGSPRSSNGISTGMRQCATNSAMAASRSMPVKAAPERNASAAVPAGMGGSNSDIVCASPPGAAA